MKYFIFPSVCAIIISTGCSPQQIREVEAIERAAIAVEEDVAKAEDGAVCLKCWDDK